MVQIKLEKCFWLIILYKITNVQLKILKLIKGESVHREFQSSRQVVKLTIPYFVYASSSLGPGNTADVQAYPSSMHITLVIRGILYQLIHSRAKERM